MTEVEPAIIEAARHSQSDPQRAAAAADRFRAAVAAIERALQGHEFLLEDRLTAADVVTGGVLGLAARRGLLPAADLPCVSAYVDRLTRGPLSRVQRQPPSPLWLSWRVHIAAG